ncbi:MAG: GNAT family N-acetyltransferase [Lachnospiraceae bacterium]|nr:GNAT family N-acetyltransferase [Lachnospiraceae bacterium]
MTKEASVKEISLEQMREIYHSELVTDFPENEVKPFSSMEKLWRKGMYRGYALWQDEKLRAYWFLLYYEKYNVYLLDYLAVVKGNRGKGYGSHALNFLATHCGQSILLIEAENPQKAANKEERDMRERRLDFYRKNGARLTGVCTQVYDAPYVIFLAGESESGKCDDEWVMKVYENLYLETILSENGHSAEEAGLLIEKGENYGTNGIDCR